MAKKQAETKFQDDVIGEFIAAQHKETMIQLVNHVGHALRSNGATDVTDNAETFVNTPNFNVMLIGMGFKFKSLQWRLSFNSGATLMTVTGGEGINRSVRLSGLTVADIINRLNTAV